MDGTNRQTKQHWATATLSRQTQAWNSRFNLNSNRRTLTKVLRAENPSRSWNATEKFSTIAYKNGTVVCVLNPPKEILQTKCPRLILRIFSPATPKPGLRPWALSLYLTHAKCCPWTPLRLILTNLIMLILTCPPDHQPLHVYTASASILPVDSGEIGFKRMN